MPSPPKEVHYAGRVFHVNENVYEPAEDSFFFAENLAIKEGDIVLDMGTGCGFLGILAAAKASQVVGVDINPMAIKCARENARLNDVAATLSVVGGDLFAPLDPGERFDIVLFNAPYLPVDCLKCDSWLERAWAGGASGGKVIGRFVADVSRYLKANGRVFLLQSTLSNVEKALQELQAQGLDARITARRDLPFFESLVFVAAD